MATEPMIAMERRLKAGQEYLGALRKLGFEPDALFWAVKSGGHQADEAFELLMVTTWTDNIGPKAVYDLLFEAYEASATPREIDPFIVSMFSPQTQVAVDLDGAFRAIKLNSKLGEHPMIILGMMDYATVPPWIISYRPQKTTRYDDMRRFRAFQRNVEKLAA